MLVVKYLRGLASPGTQDLQEPFHQGRAAKDTAVQQHRIGRR